MSSITWTDGDAGPGWYARDIWPATEQDFAEFGDETWDANPSVWAITFEREQD